MIRGALNPEEPQTDHGIRRGFFRVKGEATILKRFARKSHTGWALGKGILAKGDQSQKPTRHDPWYTTAQEEA